MTYAEGFLPHAPMALLLNAILADENTPRNVVPNSLQLAGRTGRHWSSPVPHVQCQPALSHLPALILAAAQPWKILLLESVVPQETDSC